MVWHSEPSMNWFQHIFQYIFLDFLKTSFYIFLFPITCLAKHLVEPSIFLPIPADKITKLTWFVSLCMVIDLRWAFNSVQWNSHDFFPVGCCLTLQGNYSVPSHLFSNFLLLLHNYTQLMSSPIIHWEYMGQLSNGDSLISSNLNSCLMLSPVFSWLSFVVSEVSLLPLIQSFILLLVLHSRFYPSASPPDPVVLTFLHISLVYPISHLHHILRFIHSYLHRNMLVSHIPVKTFFDFSLLGTFFPLLF